MSVPMQSADQGLPPLEGEMAKLARVALPDIMAHAGLPRAASDQIARCDDARVALRQLYEAGLHGEAARLLAFALPRREAVWWACMCARAVPLDQLGDHDKLALSSAEAWVYQGTDEQRRTAFDHAQKAGFATPEAWAAVAAFWCGDSMAPVGQPVVPPGAHLPGAAVAGAVALASVRSQPDRRAARLIRFIGGAVDIANGGGGRLEPEEN